MSRNNGEAILNSPTELYDGYLFDLDGTVYLGNRLLPGAQHTVATLLRLGRQILFVSNNPLCTCADYATKLSTFGLPVEVNQVVNSSQVMVTWLSREAPGSTLFVLGEASLLAELSTAGFHFSEDAQRIEFVVASFDRTFDYHKLKVAFDAVNAGARFIATNRDRYCPTPDGGLPDCAGIIAAIEATTGRSVEVVVGKPSPIMARTALEALGLQPGRCLMVGDRLETDIQMGLDAGMHTAVVLTGATSPAILAAAPQQPEFVLANIGLVLPASLRHYGDKLEEPGGLY